MNQAVFREAPAPVVEQPKIDLPEPEVNNQRVETDDRDNEPIEFKDGPNKSIVLEALNINEDVNSLPEEDRGNLQEVKNYVQSIIKAKGLTPTFPIFKKTLDGLKSEMGLNEEADPSIVLDRIAGVVKAWKNLSFVNNPEEKRKLFFKLANLKSSKDMNEAVFRAMQNYKVWE
jgi:hypothetical protein